MSRKCNRLEIFIAKRNRGEYGQGWDLACGGAGHRAVEKETHQLKLWEKQRDAQGCLGIHFDSFCLILIDFDSV